MPLGEVLRRRREELGLGQGELASDLGVSQQTVSRWEHAVSVPRPRRLAQIADVLGLDPAELQRLAGYLAETAPPEGADNVDAVLARRTALSDADVVALVDGAWHELKRRLDVRAAG